jgi:hypothetical protein
MKRTVLTALILLSTSTVAVAQVRIMLSSQRFGVQEQSRAKVVNEGTQRLARRGGNAEDTVGKSDA